MLMGAFHHREGFRTVQAVWPTAIDQDPCTVYTAGTPNVTDMEAECMYLLCVWCAIHEPGTIRSFSRMSIFQ